MIGMPARAMRLRAERPWQEHAGLYRDLFADPAVAATLWPGAREQPRTDRQASEILATDILHWQQERFGPWVFFESATGVFIGRCGLRRTTVLERRSVELLYAVRSDSWGEGYATEMATIAMTHARRLGLAEVVGFTATTNTASRRVLEKVGMHFETIFEHAGLPHWLGRSHLRREPISDRDSPLDRLA
jgi:[ribosomal protein S5]-alanine N-acetyltransferase